MNMKRMRGRNHRSGGGGGGGGGPVRHQSGNVPLNRNHVFDSIGPDLRVRGTSQQLFEKYLQLGRDATSGGDRVMAESYFQHAEHYFRILNAMNLAAAAQAPQQPQGGQPNVQQSGQSQRFRADQPEQEGRPEQRPEPRQELRNEPQTSDPNRPIRDVMDDLDDDEDEAPEPVATAEPREIPIGAAPPEH